MFCWGMRDISNHKEGLPAAVKYTCTHTGYKNTPSLYFGEKIIFLIWYFNTRLIKYILSAFLD